MEDGARQPGQPKSNVLSFCLSVAHNFTQLCLGAIVYSALMVAIGLGSVPLTSSLRQHIILCIIGYFILMTQSILLFSPYGWANHLKFETKRLVHAAMQVIGSIFVISGSIVRMTSVNNSFTTAHGIFGILAMLLAMVNLIGGALGYFFPQKMNNKTSKLVHACIGAVTLVFAFIALMIAFGNSYRTLFGDGNANLSIILTLLALLGTLVMSGVKNVNRVMNK